MAGIAQSIISHITKKEKFYFLKSKFLNILLQIKVISYPMKKSLIIWTKLGVKTAI